MIQTLGSPIQVGRLTLPNRFMRSATCEIGADAEGYPTPGLLRMMEKLAKGKCGLIIPGYVYVNKDGQGHSMQAGFDTDDKANCWIETIDKIHQHGSKIAIQIVHCGFMSFFGKMRGPGSIDIPRVISDFRDAAVRAQKVGADAVQLHCAHNYLLSQFLTPLTNWNKGEYNRKTVDNRVRIVKDIVKEIKAATNLPIFIKINGDDYMPFGNSPEVTAEIVSKLDGVDLVEVSCGALGTIRTRPRGIISKTLDKISPTPFKEGYNLDSAVVIKKKNPAKVIASVGGWRDAEKMAEAIQSGSCDIISMSRPFLREPNLAARILSGKTTKSGCLSCKGCFPIPYNAMFGKKLLRCAYPTE